MSTMVFTRETLASLFRAAAEALQSPIPSESQSPSPGAGTDYPKALEIYIQAHSKELGALVNWLKKKYAAEPTANKAKSLLAYAQRQVDMSRAESHSMPTF